MGSPRDTSRDRGPAGDPDARFRPPARGRARRRGVGAWPTYTTEVGSPPDPLDETLSDARLRRAASRRAPRVRDRRRSRIATPRTAPPTPSRDGGHPGSRRTMAMRPAPAARTWWTPTTTRAGAERHVLSPVRYRSAALAFVTGLWQGAGVAVLAALLLTVAGADGGASPFGWLAAVAAVGAVVGMCVPMLRLRWSSAPWGSTTPLAVRWFAWTGGASLALMIVLVRWAAVS